MVRSHHVTCDLFFLLMRSKEHALNPEERERERVATRKIVVAITSCERAHTWPIPVSIWKVIHYGPRHVLTFSYIIHDDPICFAYTFTGTEFPVRFSDRIELYCLCDANTTCNKSALHSSFSQRFMRYQISPAPEYKNPNQPFCLQ